MKKFTIYLTDETATFYQKVAEQAGRPVDQVLADALFRLAGELSLEALHKKKQKDM